MHISFLPHIKTFQVSANQLSFNKKKGKRKKCSWEFEKKKKHALMHKIKCILETTCDVIEE